MNNTSVRKRHHYRIADPFRFFMFVLFCIMILAFAAYSIAGVSDAQAAAVSRYAQVIVSEDDTLWSIVERYNPDADIDIRSAVLDIYEINDMDEGSIRPGDKIFVPVY